MATQRVERIQEYLGIAAPASFAKFLLSRVTDDQYSVWEDKKGIREAILFGGVDAVIVKNLQRREDSNAPSGSAWSKHWLAIGDDGCGNTLFLDTSEGVEPKVLLWSHDPPDQVEDVAPSFTKFLAKISKKARPTGGQAEEETRGLVEVARTKPAWKSILDPIGLDEWSACVNSDPSLTFLRHHDQQNPFTGERILLKARLGEAEWKRSAKDKVPIDYRYGRLTMEGLEKAHVEKMTGIARALKARLFGPDGKEIRIG